jgi:hypothetical protein
MQVTSWPGAHAHSSRRVATLLVLLLLGSASAHATTVVAMSNRALTQTADMIVIGRCTGVRSVWEGRTLVTQATIAVSESLKGGGATTITVTVPGGIDALRRFPVSMTYPGAPRITVGEDVFLFLARDVRTPGGLNVVGSSQGKFSIVRDDAGQLAVSRNLSTVTLASPAGTRQGTAMRLPFARFRDEIRGYLQR